MVGEAISHYRVLERLGGGRRVRLGCGGDAAKAIQESQKRLAGVVSSGLNEENSSGLSSTLKCFLLTFPFIGRPIIRSFPVGWLTTAFPSMCWLSVKWRSDVLR